MGGWWEGQKTKRAYLGEVSRGKPVVPPVTWAEQLCRRGSSGILGAERGWARHGGSWARHGVPFSPFQLWLT